ncbi:hypothetical protein TNCV_2248571 [Trichonephila clavipes]|nr:hypothetical protein TNCV_2248571 [Trichonephila clavipes]
MFSVTPLSTFTYGVDNYVMKGMGGSPMPPAISDWKEHGSATGTLSLGSKHHLFYPNKSVSGHGHSCHRTT